MTDDIKSGLDLLATSANILGIDMTDDIKSGLDLLATSANIAQRVRDQSFCLGLTFSLLLPIWGRH